MTTTFPAILDLAGIALSDSDMLVVAPQKSYLVPKEIRLGDAKEFGESIKKHPLRLFLKNGYWPWLRRLNAPVLAWQPITATAIERDEVHRSPTRDSCLSEFVQLAELPDDSFAQGVLRCAKRWGPIEVCRHGKPVRHSPQDCVHDSAVNVPWMTEPLEAWRRYARHLRGLLLVAANLRRDQPEGGAATDWQAVTDVEPAMVWQAQPRGLEIYAPQPEGTGEIWAPSPSKSKQERIRNERISVARAVRIWFEYGGVNLVPFWRAESLLTIKTIYDGLAGRLAVDLASALSSAAGLYRCSGCGRPFLSEERRRAHNRNKWCDAPNCKAEQLRRNSKRYYERKSQRYRRNVR